MAAVGKSLSTQLERVKSEKITGINSVGTMTWIHTASGNDAEELRDHLRRKGVLVRLNGTKGVMARPSLTLDD